MSISNALHFSPAGGNDLRAALPSLSARQEAHVLVAIMAMFFAGSAGTAMVALSALGQ